MFPSLVSNLWGHVTPASASQVAGIGGEWYCAQPALQSNIVFFMLH